MNRYVSLALFLALMIGGGGLIGANNIPGEWYQGLAKPPFNPPNWIFAPVWTLLYILIAIAGWRTWLRAPKGAAMIFWAIQLGLNFLWSPIFFSAENPALALVIILGLLAAIFAFMRLNWAVDRPSALMFAPYAAWVSFASLLNASIVWLN